MTLPSDALLDQALQRAGLTHCFSVPYAWARGKEPEFQALADPVLLRQRPVPRPSVPRVPARSPRQRTTRAPRGHTPGGGTVPREPTGR